MTLDKLYQHLQMLHNHQEYLTFTVKFCDTSLYSDLHIIELDFRNKLILLKSK